MRISDWSSDVCSSDLSGGAVSVAAELHGSGGSGGGSGIAVRAGGAGSGGGVAAGGDGGAVLACDRCAAGERDARGCGCGCAGDGTGRGSASAEAGAAADFGGAVGGKVGGCRSEEGRVGEEWGRSGRSRGGTGH